MEHVQKFLIFWGGEFIPAVVPGKNLFIPLLRQSHQCLISILTVLLLFIEYF